MAKKIDPEKIIEQVKLLSTAQQIEILKAVNQILAEKEQAAANELNLLKSGK